METKNIVNKISDQKNVGSMRTELNELKVLYNSLESAVIDYTEARDTSVKALDEIGAKLEEAKASALRNAEAKFKEEDEKLVAAKNDAFAELNKTSNEINELEAQEEKSTAEISKLESHCQSYENDFNKFTKEMSDLEESYNQEVKDFEVGFSSGQIMGIKDPQFITKEDIIEINKLLNSKFNLFGINKKASTKRQNALVNAEVAFESNEQGLKIERDMVKKLIDDTKAKIEKIKENLPAVSQKLEQARETKVISEEKYNSIVIKLDNLRTSYASSKEAFANPNGEPMDTNPVITAFFDQNDVTEIEALLGLEVLHKEKINEYQEKIDNSIQERDVVAGKIADLDAKVQQILLEREVCKLAVGAATDKVAKKTGEVAGKAAVGIEKGVKVASTLAKYGIDQAKKKVDAMLQEIEENEVSEATQQENNEPVQNEQFGYSPEDLKNFVGDLDLQGMANEAKKMAEELGLKDLAKEAEKMAEEFSLKDFAKEAEKMAEELKVKETFEKGKTYFKTVTRNWGNLGKKGKKDDEE